MSSKKQRKKNKRKKQKQRTTTVIVGLCCVAVLGLSGVLAFNYVEAFTARNNEPIPVELDHNFGVQQYVEEFFADNDAEEMLPIIACESRFRHYDEDGTVLKNMEGSSAVGIAQILTSKHPDPKVLKKFNRRHNTQLTAEDFNLTTLQGNLGYALVLYQVRGTRDWECAKKLR